MSIQWPLNNVSVTGEFGNSPKFYRQYGQRGHNGIDLAASVGTPVYATDSGTIAFEGWGQYHSWMGSIAGISVLISHGWGFSGYAHLSSTVVNTGQYVKRGQLIGYSGATGVGTGPHLHFETFPLNPYFANGYAGRINPRTLGLVPRGSEKPKPKPKPKEIKVKHYHKEDRLARSKGRVLAPNDAFYLHTNPKAARSNAENIAGGVGQYSFSIHTYAHGTPGDVVELYLLFQSDPAGKPSSSPHYVERMVVDKDGQIRANVEFKRYVGGKKPMAVYARLSAPKTNKGKVTVTLLDSDAYLFSVA